MKTASAKAKGRDFQKDIVFAIQKWLNLTDDDIRPVAASVNGVDIELTSKQARELFPYGVECKRQEKLNIWDAISQCETNADAIGKRPLLVFKRNRSEIYAAMPFYWLMYLIEENNRLKGLIHDNSTHG